MKVILCAESSSPHAVAAWLRLGFDDVISPTLLPSHLDRKSTRPQLGPARWLAFVPNPGSLAFVAAAAVDDLPSPTVDDWTALLGWSPSKLYRLCKRDLAATPNDLLLRYVAVSAATMNAAGVTRWETAMALGYSDAAALCHALRAARRKGLSNGENKQRV
jgi:AraC-like DNA-binding protein